MTISNDTVESRLKLRFTSLNSYKFSSGFYIPGGLLPILYWLNFVFVFNSHCIYFNSKVLCLFAVVGFLLYWSINYDRCLTITCYKISRRPMCCILRVFFRKTARKERTNVSETGTSLEDELKPRDSSDSESVDSHVVTQRSLMDVI